MRPCQNKQAAVLDQQQATCNKPPAVHCTLPHTARHHYPPQARACCCQHTTASTTTAPSHRHHHQQHPRAMTRTTHQHPTPHVHSCLHHPPVSTAPPLPPISLPPPPSSTSLPLPAFPHRHQPTPPRRHATLPKKHEQTHLRPTVCAPFRRTRFFNQPRDPAKGAQPLPPTCLLQQLRFATTTATRNYESPHDMVVVRQIRPDFLGRSGATSVWAFVHVSIHACPPRCRGLTSPAHHAFDADGETYWYSVPPNVSEELAPYHAATLKRLRVRWPQRCS